MSKSSKSRGPVNIEIPPPTYFQNESGDRVDKAANKTRALATIIECGSAKEAIRSGKIDPETLRRYLADGNFEDKLRSIESEMAASLTQVAYNKALAGSEKMLEFVLPALSDRFDSGIRRQNVANKGTLASILLSKTLSAEDAANITDVTALPDACSLLGKGMANDISKLDGRAQPTTQVSDGEVLYPPITADLFYPDLPPSSKKKSE